MPCDDPTYQSWLLGHIANTMPVQLGVQGTNVPTWWTEPATKAVAPKNSLFRKEVHFADLLIPPNTLFSLPPIALYLPSIRTLPISGSYNRKMSLRMVDLPMPDAQINSMR